MRIFLNTLAALQQKSGIGHYIAQLAAALEAESPKDELIYWPRRPSISPSSNKAQSSRRHTWQTKILAQVKPLVRAGLHCHFGFAVRSQHLDVYHEPNYLAFPSPVPTVLTVHDLSVLQHPEWHPADRVRLHQKLFPRSLGQAKHIITDTEAIRRELILNFNIDGRRVTVVPLGVHSSFQRIPELQLEPFRVKYGLPKRFFLCVGTVEPRKNLSMLFRAYLDLSRTLRDQCPLIFVGGWGWKSTETQALVHDAGDDSGLRHLGYVADEDLPKLYSAATALLYPSHYEGFGLPPLEMFACGGAVLASHDPAVQEVTQGKAFTIHADDQEGWHDAMRRLIGEPSWAKELRQGTARIAAQYTWAATAQRTLAIYKQVARS